MLSTAPSINFGGPQNTDFKKYRKVSLIKAKKKPCQQTTFVQHEISKITKSVSLGPYIRYYVMESLTVKRTGNLSLISKKYTIKLLRRIYTAQEKHLGRGTKERIDVQKEEDEGTTTLTPNFIVIQKAVTPIWGRNGEAYKWQTFCCEEGRKTAGHKMGGTALVDNHATEHIPNRVHSSVV